MTPMDALLAYYAIITACMFTLMAPLLIEAWVLVRK